MTDLDPFDVVPAAWQHSAVLLRSGVDENGDPIPATPAASFPVVLTIEDTREPIARSEAVTTTATAFAPYEIAEIRSTDRLLIGGDAFAVVGDPIRWPLGWQMQLRKETGS